MGPCRGRAAVRIGLEGPGPYNPRLYRKILPADLQDAIEGLWGTVMLPRWPDRIVTEIAPHALMADTFGSALSFWHGCALTAWFICEGPTSRTDIPGLAAYYGDALSELDRLGCPIQAGIFADLRGAEARLGPAKPLRGQVSSKEVAPGIWMTLQMNAGSRRAGFERLRDVITRHRRAWAVDHR